MLPGDHVMFLRRKHLLRVAEQSSSWWKHLAESPPTNPEGATRRFNLDARCASTMLAVLASEGVQLCLDASIHLRRLQCISAGSRDKKRRYQTIQSIRTPHAYSRVGHGLVKAHLRLCFTHYLCATRGGDDERRESGQRSEAAAMTRGHTFSRNAPKRQCATVGQRCRWR